jgi:hypothetical protein
MIEKILLWIAQATLNWALARTQAKLINLYELVKDDKEFDESNKKNVEKYNAAKDRLDKIKAAENLLSHTKS